MKKIIRYLVIFIAVFCSSELQAQILSVGLGNGFNIGAGTIVSLDSIELNPSATYSFSNNTLSKSNTVSNSTTITYINKVYQFSATSDPYSGVLKLYYNNNQLNGLTASDLKLLLFNGTSWSLDSNSSSITASNVVFNSSVTGVSLKEISAATCSPNTGDTTASACGNFVWYGVTYTASATPTRTFTNAAGCDSVVTLNLTIRSSNTGSSSATACDTYTWSSSTYTTSGTYTKTLTNAAGCDSVHTLSLTINSSNTGSSSATACNTYTWSGSTYTTSGTYTKTLTNAASCDSVHTLNLTINTTPAFTTCPGNLSKFTTSTSCDTVVNFSAVASGSPAPTYSYSLSGATSGSGTGTGTGLLFSKGVTTITITATNLCGSIQCSFTVTVTDNTGPSITCSGPVTINNTTGLCTGTTTLTAPTVSDNCVSFNNALNFDGVNDMVSRPALPATSNLTIETWIRPTAVFGFGAIDDETWTTGGFHFQLYGSKIGFSINGNNPTDFVSTATVATNTWTHVAVVYQKSSATAKLYINGSLSQTMNYTTAVNLTSQVSNIGSWGASRYFSGSIDELRIWNLARTQTEIYDAMNSSLSSQSGLVANYTFNQGVAGGANTSITQATDGSGNGYHGTLSGFGLTGANSNFVSGNTTDLTVTNNAPLTYPIGNTTVTWTATDASGNAATCTQVVTVVNTSVGSSSLTTCNSYLWTNGTTYTTSGAYVYTFTNAAGCDSVHTLTLTINSSNTGSSSATACNTYTWSGSTYTTSGTYTKTLTNAAGCDSVHTLTLTINSSNTGSSSATACNTYTWSGSTYTTSGSYTKTLTNAAGCDSVHTLSLTINYSTSSSVTVSQLGCYTWALNAVTYTVSGNYSLTYTNAIGCDSIVTLYLTISPGVYLNAKAILSGPYVTAAALMHDSLRVNGLIPTTEPYTSSPYNKTAIGGSSGETVSNAILNVSGSNAIVDWVFIELRDAASNGTVVANKRALIQRDGDIVSSTDGTSPVYFPTVANGNYYVSIKHRNHLGVMSLNAISFSGCSTRSIDFTTSDPVYTMLCANPAQRKQIGSVYALWAGDANNNKNVKYNGLSNDKDALIYVLGISTPNNTVSRVYRMEDVNLDGKIRYNNTDNDRVIILNNVGVSTPNNVYFQHTPN